MARFNLEVGIESAGARRGGSEVKRALQDIKRSSDATQRSAKKTEQALGGIGRAGRLIRNTIGLLFGGAAVRSIANAADSYTKLSNQIGLVTENSTQAAVIQRELFDLASRSRAPIEEIGTLYGRAALSARELGATQGELLEFTEGVAQALAINGSNAQEARGALIQLSQALGSGIVRAEEFNAVLEGARPVLVAVADGMDLTVAQLRQLVIDGEITSREFFDAFQSQLGNLDEQFQKTNKTIGQAGTELNNAFVEAVGTINTFSGASNGIVEIFGRLADFIRGPLVDGFIAFSLQIGQLITDFDNLFTAIGDLGRQFIGFVNGSIEGSTTYADAVGERLVSPWQTLRDAISIVTVEFAEGLDKISGGFTLATGLLTNDAQAIEDGLNQIEIAADAKLSTVTKIFAESEAAAKRFDDAVKGVRNTFNAQDRLDTLGSTPTLGSGGGGGGGAEGPPDALRDQIGAFNAANDPAEKFKQTIAEIQALQASADEFGLTISTEALVKAVQDASNELTGYQELLDRGAEITREVATPTEIYKESIDELNTLLDAGAISQETFARASKDALDELTGFNDLLAEGKDLTESLLTPQERYNDSLERFAELLAKGVISEETFNRAREAAKKTLEETNEDLEFFKEVGRAAARDIQGAFVDLFLGVANGADDLADSLGETFQRIAANFLANQALKALFGALGGIGGPIGQAAQTFAGEFNEGGRIGAGQFGIAGERGPEIITGPANVLSTANTAAMMSPDVKLNLINVTNPADILDVLDTSSGEKNLVNNIRRNREAVLRELGIQ